MANLIVPHIIGPYDSIELRFCLRSIAANLHDGEHTLTLAGECPTWLKPDQCLQVTMDSRRAKVASIRKGVIAACEAVRDQSSALYIDDDYYLLEPVEDVIPLYWGDLAEHCAQIVQRHKPRFWLSQAHLATRDYLPQGALSWELHRPLPIAPEQALDVLPGGDEPYLWRSVYGNLASHGRPVYRGHDGKVAGPRLPIGATWLSSSLEAWRVLFKVLRTRFTDPSPWEISPLA